MTSKVTTLVPALWLALLLAAHARGAEVAPSVGWTPEVMLRVKQVGGVQVSPDGKMVAYDVRRAVIEGEKSEFVSRIHVANHDGASGYPLTQSEHSSDGPQWSPDGETIAFLSRRSDRTQVWAIPVQGGEARRLTDAEGGVVSFRWAPDGRRVAYAATDPVFEGRAKQVKEKDDARVVGERFERVRLHVIDTGEGDGEPRTGRMLTGSDLSIYGDTTPGFDWSPDGSSIVFAHVPRPTADDWVNADISVVDVETGTVRALVDSSRAESSPSFSPDGRWVAYVASDDPPTWAYDSAVTFVPAEGGTPRKLADSFDHRPELLGWSADGARVIFRENRGTTTRLFELPLDGEPRGIGPEVGVIAEASLNASRTAIGFSYQTADRPAEAFLARLDRSESVKVSRSNEGLPDLPRVRTEAIRWRSQDGMEVEGLLTYPVGYQEGKRCPLLLVIHGGPAGVFTRTFTGSPVVSTSGGRHSTSTYPLAAFAARGYAVLRCNVRGSSGYGKDFRHANLNDWGGGDYRDLMAGVDHVIALGIADPDRLGVMGWSYGGFLTSWVIGHTGRFRAASVGAGVTDLVSFSGTSDIHGFLPSFFGGEPWDCARLYREHSPISHVKGVKTPTLIQHGEDDERVPITQGYELYNALKRQGCPVEMITYPRAHHAIQEPKLLLDAMKRNLDWFGKYVPATGSQSDSRDKAAAGRGGYPPHASREPAGREVREVTREGDRADFRSLR